MNIHEKHSLKIFANRIQQSIKSVTQRDLGFSLGIQSWFNIQKPMAETHHINRREQRSCCYQKMQENCLTKCSICSWEQVPGNKNLVSCSSCMKRSDKSPGVCVTLNQKLHVFPWEFEEASSPAPVHHRALKCQLVRSGHQNLKRGKRHSGWKE